MIDGLTVLVHDDLPDSTQRFQQKIKDATSEAGVEVEEIITCHGSEGPDFAEEFDILRQRQKKVRGEEDPTETPETVFDRSDLVFLDYHLDEEDDNLGVLSGEELAYYPRAFSTCGLLISVNQVLGPKFDLEMSEPPAKWSDVAISEEILSSPGLWEPDGWSEFRPWLWPHLPSRVESYYRAVDDAQENLGTKLVDLLGFERRIQKTIPQQSIDYFDHDEIFSEMDLRSISSWKLKPKDGEEVDDIPAPWLAHFAVSTVSKWLLYDLLPRQNVLVDAPHLVYRYPSVLCDDPSDKPPQDKDLFDQCCRADGKVPEPLHEERIREDAFEKWYWIGRRTWWETDLSSNENLYEVSNSIDAYPSPLVFAEDASAFFELEEDECESWRIAPETPYKRRYVHLFDGVDYEPRSRLADSLE